jgi:hypothetical protein
MNNHTIKLIVLSMLFFLALMSVFTLYFFIGIKNVYTKNENIEVLCSSMAKRSVDKVQFEHKYDKKVYDNFEYQFNFECLRMLEMRL